MKRLLDNGEPLPDIPWKRIKSFWYYFVIFFIFVVIL